MKRSEMLTCSNLEIDRNMNTKKDTCTCNCESGKFDISDNVVDGLAYFLFFLIMGPIPLFCMYVLENQLTLLGWLAL